MERILATSIALGLGLPALGAYLYVQRNGVPEPLARFQRRRVVTAAATTTAQGATCGRGTGHERAGITPTTIRPGRFPRYSRAVTRSGSATPLHGRTGPRGGARNRNRMFRRGGMARRDRNRRRGRSVQGGGIGCGVGRARPETGTRGPQRRRGSGPSANRGDRANREQPGRTRRLHEAEQPREPRRLPDGERRRQPRPLRESGQPRNLAVGRVAAAARAPAVYAA